MRGGRRLSEFRTWLPRATTQKTNSRGFPSRSRGSNPITYPVEIGAPLRELALELDRQAGIDGNSV